MHLLWKYLSWYQLDKVYVTRSHLNYDHYFLFWSYMQENFNSSAESSCSPDFIKIILKLIKYIANKNMKSQKMFVSYH